MKPFVVFVLIAFFPFGIPILSQTPDIENEALQKRYLAKEMTQLEYKDIAIAWRTIMEEHSYPEMPYNSDSKRIEFEYISTFAGVSKDQIFSRTLEWAALSFGSLNEVLHYQNNESGKIILKGHFKVPFIDRKIGFFSDKEVINSNNCYLTFLFTVKDNKLKTEILNIEYNYTTRYWNSTSYVPDRTLKVNLMEYFPISSNDKEEWRGLLSLFQETQIKLDDLYTTLKLYISNIENDYIF